LNLGTGYDGLPPNGLRFSCRLAAFANATEVRVVVDSKTQNSSDLARRKAVNCNRLFGGSRFMAFEWALSRFRVTPYGRSLPYIVSICTSFASTSCILAELMVPAR